MTRVRYFISSTGDRVLVSREPHNSRLTVPKLIAEIVGVKKARGGYVIKFKRGDLDDLPESVVRAVIKVWGKHKGIVLDRSE